MDYILELNNLVKQDEESIYFLGLRLGNNFLAKTDNSMRPVYVRETGIMLAQNFDRVSSGRTSFYLEISEEDLIQENIIVMPGQEFRINSDKYSCTFELYTDTKSQTIKLYKQIGKCKYSDFRIGYYHVSLTDIFCK